MNGYYTPAEILEAVKAKGVEKANNTPLKLFILAFLAGMYVALGFMAYVRVTGTMPKELGSFGTFMGACIFPVGLMAILLGGGELVTGNMLMISAAVFSKLATIKGLIYNWTVVTFGNLVGSIFTAYFFGHITGITEGDFLYKTIAVASDKVSQPFLPALVSGIGCNILVGVAVWLSLGAKDFTGKMLSIWFPITAFVAIGFQHVVANMFIIPAAIFSGESGITWGQFFSNIAAAFIGNAIGAVFVLSLLYSIVYSKSEKTSKREVTHV